MAYFHCLIGGGSSGGGYTLTVTCDSQFAGTTITCTDGVTTLTQTCPSASPYEVEFEIPNGGDWTISGVVSGQTITTGVNIPTTAELIAFVHKTITIYSAKEDTVTYTDIYGDTQTEVFASGQTSKSITVDIMPSGSSITFTSGVAKDPSDLAAYYSKTVTIDSNTTDVYVMPDGALYWYGWQSTDLQACTSANGWSFSTGATLLNPTFNTNNFVCHPTGTSNACLVGKTTSTESGKTVHSIGQCTRRYDFYKGTSKAINNNSVYYDTTTSLKHHTKTLTETVGNICIGGDYYENTITTYAFWID